MKQITLVTCLRCKEPLLKDDVFCTISPKNPAEFDFELHIGLCSKCRKEVITDIATYGTAKLFPLG